ncbi:hypothetical protein AB1Y20_003266 [Prymnesium parvum]|uniref:Uncharacterized protein n=1 Tax=Prymnesium parvum TaxID=97485 RepID=A0AB34JCX8_PRYPA
MSAEVWIFEAEQSVNPGERRAAAAPARGRRAKRRRLPPQHPGVRGVLRLPLQPAEDDTFRTNISWQSVGRRALREQRGARPPASPRRHNLAWRHLIHHTTTLQHHIH